MFKKITVILAAILSQLEELSTIASDCRDELRKFNAPSTPVVQKDGKRAPYHKYPDYKNEAALFAAAGYVRQDIKALYYAAAKCGVRPERKGSHIYVPKRYFDNMVAELRLYKEQDNKE